MIFITSQIADRKLHVVSTACAKCVRRARIFGIKGLHADRRLEHSLTAAAIRSAASRCKRQLNKAILCNLMLAKSWNITLIMLVQMLDAFKRHMPIKKRGEQIFSKCRAQTNEKKEND